MTETTRRTLRTLLHTLVGFVLAGGLSEIVAPTPTSGGSPAPTACCWPGC